MGMRTTLFLVAIIGGLSATLWFTDRKPPENKVVQTAALEGRSLGDCKVMRWKFADQPAIEVSKDAKGYFSLSEPIVDLAAFAYMKQIVNAWDSAQLLATDFVNDPKGQQETGLQVPEVEFTAEWPDGKKIQIDVGATGPLGTDRFMRREGRIYRGGEGIYESLRVGIDDLRERAVFLTTEAQCAELLVEQIQETGKRERLHLERDRSNGGWRLKEPRASRAEQGAAIQFVTGVLSLRADDFPGGLWRLPEREPDLVITVRGARGEESVKLWEAEGSVFGLLPGRNGIGFTTGNRGYSQIFQNQAQSLRATILLPFQNLAESLAEMQIDPGQGRGDRIRLVRSTVAEEWRLIEPVEFRAGATPVNELIQGLNNLRVIEFADDLTADSPQCGLGVGRLQVSVRGLDQKELTTLWIGADVTKNDLPLCYVCRADDPAGVVLVPRRVAAHHDRGAARTAPWHRPPHLPHRWQTLATRRRRRRPRRGGWLRERRAARLAWSGRRRPARWQLWRAGLDDGPLPRERRRVDHAARLGSQQASAARAAAVGATRPAGQRRL